MEMCLALLKFSIIVLFHQCTTGRSTFYYFNHFSSKRGFCIGEGMMITYVKD